MSSVAPDEQVMMPQAFVDNPAVDYQRLFELAGGIEHSLGTIEGDVEIAVCGLGTSGCFGGGHLARAGARVTAIERSDEPGGRLRSLKVGEKNVFELGAMRFPPSETLLYLSAARHGFGFIVGFPDPGLYPTLIVSVAQGLDVIWDDPSRPPEPIVPIIKAFHALQVDGITKDGADVLCPLNRLRQWLQSPIREVRLQVVAEWQKWLDVFGSSTFEETIRRIWGEREHEWDVPGGVPLSEAHIKLFGDVGFGTGGLRDIFDRSGLAILRLLPNGLESQQATFGRRNVDGTLSPAASQDLVRAQCASAVDAGMSCMFATEVTDLKVVHCPSGRKVELELTSRNGERTLRRYDAVVLTLGLRTPLMQKLAREGLFAPDVCQAILDLDVIAATKLFNVIPKYTSRSPETYPRNVLTDSVPGQMYTLDYGDADTMTAVEEYSWHGGSRQVEDLTAQQLHDKIIDGLERITKGTPYADLADRFRSLSAEHLVKIDWQKEPGFWGAYSLAGRRQDKLVSALAHDFLKLQKDPDAMPIFIASDMTAHEGGWIDGGLRSMTNTVAALIDRFGTLKHPEEAPVNIMKEDLYNYE